MDNKLLAITMGDPAGIGPEITLKALKNKEPYKGCMPIIIGDKNVITRVSSIVNFDGEVNVIKDVKKYKDGKLNLVSLDNMSFDYAFGKVQARCGRAAFEYIKKAIELALDGSIHAVVTAPINKEALNLAGFSYAGHTEIFAEFTSTKDYAMMLAGDRLKAIHVSTHVSLRQACDLVKKERVYAVIKLAGKAMKDLGLPSPKIAVAGLNPHAGESSMFGLEEKEQITPAIHQAKEEGMNVEGPFPPDTILLHVKDGLYDIAVCMYHDQGHIPLKLYDFRGFVNVTVGLPIIRTSVGHGTAFDKAGKAVADETNMIKAINMAAKLARNKA